MLARDPAQDAVQALLPRFGTAALGFERCHASPAGGILGRAGSRDKARRVLGELTRQRSTRYVSPVDIGLVLTGLGEIDGALTALEEGFRTRAARMLAVGDRFFAELLSAEHRYRRLLADLRLPLPSP